MFRIEAFCDDKQLPRVLHALTGLLLGTPKVQPVANAQAKNGQIKAKVNGELPAMFQAHIKQHHYKSVTPTDIKAFAVQHGYAEASYSLLLSKMVKAKVLRKIPSAKGNKSRYLVVGAK
jgi:hypothetical protein